MRQKDDTTLIRRLQNFTTRHTSHHIPIALVTSGGTSAPLEHNCVRYLDNFSTGTRGAYAVEEFCKRGYAVIHLRRVGSVAPFGRVLSNILKCGRDGLSFDTLGGLFNCAITSDGDDDDDDISNFLQQDLDDDDELLDRKKEDIPNESNYSADPWMYSSNHHQRCTKPIYKRSKQRTGEVTLNPQLANSSILQSTLRTYKRIKQHGMLLTIDFQTVDDYLNKLQLCSEAINTCGSLALVYLAAAVSDFYIPKEKRVLHKIQSRDYRIKSQASSSASSSSSLGDNNEETAENTIQIQADNTLTLTLYPVPKVIPTLRKEWCPAAFVISFKLETDTSILQQKAVLAMKRNNVHMVVGNELATRYEKVFILSHKIDDLDRDVDEVGDTASTNSLPEGYHIAEVTAASGISMFDSESSTSSVDALESATIEYVVKRHFYYISTNMSGATMPNMKSAAEVVASQMLQAKSTHDERINSRLRKLQWERVKIRVAELAWNVGGSLFGMALSYGIATLMQRRHS